MITPVPFLANAWRKALPPQLDGLREVLDGLLEPPLSERDEAQVVEALSVPIEAVDEEPKHRYGPIVFATFIQAGRVLLGVGRHIATQKGKPPVEGVIAVPFAWSVVLELEPPCDQVRQVLELVAVFLNDVRSRFEILGVCRISCRVNAHRSSRKRARSRCERYSSRSGSTSRCSWMAARISSS